MCLGAGVVVLLWTRTVQIMQDSIETSRSKSSSACYCLYLAPCRALRLAPTSPIHAYRCDGCFISWLSGSTIRAVYWCKSTTKLLQIQPPPSMLWS